MFRRNVGIYLLAHTVSQLRTSPSSPPWEPQIPHFLNIVFFFCLLTTFNWLLKDQHSFKYRVLTLFLYYKLFDTCVKFNRNPLSSFGDEICGVTDRQTRVSHCAFILHKIILIFTTFSVNFSLRVWFQTMYVGSTSWGDAGLRRHTAGRQVSDTGLLADGYDLTLGSYWTLMRCCNRPR
jgi:hypothetical protein